MHNFVKLHQNHWCLLRFFWGNQQDLTKIQDGKDKCSWLHIWQKFRRWINEQNTRNWSGSQLKRIDLLTWRSTKMLSCGWGSIIRKSTQRRSNFRLTGRTSLLRKKRGKNQQQKLVLCWLKCRKGIAFKKFVKSLILLENNFTIITPIKFDFHNIEIRNFGCSKHRNLIN